MSYSGVGKPKFFIDYLSHWQLRGLVDKIEPASPEYTLVEGNFVGLNPTSPCIIRQASFDGDCVVRIKLKYPVIRNILETVDYFGLIGHNCHKNAIISHSSGNSSTVDLMMGIEGGAIDLEGIEGEAQASLEFFKFESPPHSNRDSIINSVPYKDSMGEDLYRFPYNGFSLQEGKFDFIYGPGEFDDIWEELGFDGSADHSTNYISIRFKGINLSNGSAIAGFIAKLDLSSFIFGHTYTMGQSPDLDVSMEIEFDGFDQVDTVGGSTLTNIRYHGAPKWGGIMNPWEVWHPDDIIFNVNRTPMTRNGRRNWSIKFSYLDEKDVFSSNYATNSYINLNDTANWTDYFNNGDTLAGTDYNDGVGQEDFEHSLVRSFKYTIHDDDSIFSRLFNFVGNGERFLFQPDSNLSNPSDFAICVMDQDSLQIKQTAHRVYDIAMKIREVW